MLLATSTAEKNVALDCSSKTAPRGVRRRARLRIVLRARGDSGAALHCSVGQFLRPSLRPVLRRASSPAIQKWDVTVHAAASLVKKHQRSIGRAGQDLVSTDECCERKMETHV